MNTTPVYATLRVAAAQLDARLGDIAGNTAALTDAYARADADLVVAPEMAICGYPPEDLLGEHGFAAACADAAATLSGTTSATPLVFGSVSPTTPRHSLDAQPRQILNVAVAASNGTQLGEYHKRRLPTYGPFDEARWVAPGSADPLVVAAKATTPDGATITVGAAVVVCEDLWHLDTVLEIVPDTADLIVALNASPFQVGRRGDRVEVAAAAARATRLPVVYVNACGAQDDLVFDGASFVVDPSGALVAVAPAFEPGVFELAVPVAVHGMAHTADSCTVAPPVAAWDRSADEDLWSALTMSIADYCDKLSVNGVWIGLSGGIDSAVVTALAVDALGPHRVHTVAMPGPYTSDESNELAAELAARAGVDHRSHSIVAADSTLFASFGDEMAPTGAARENLQARLRGVVLMGYANAHGGIVLTCGNKSELSVGYATLGGDLMGGYGPLRDIPKSTVFRLARWRNTRDPNPPIPQRIIDRQPSAELAPDQVDSVALGSYDDLDRVLAAYVEQRRTPASIAADTGCDLTYVRRICDMVDRAEFKRRQAPIGPKVTPRAFGRDRRLPITARRPAR